MKDAPSSGSPAGLGFWGRWGSLACGLLLAAGTLAVYWPVTGFDFINFDDQDYITKNPHVQAGITREGVSWALRASDMGNWHPLTWVSHMLDCQWHGLRPGRHHLTSLVLHAANAWLLFALWLRMTGRRGPSFAVAALFAWHPLHVESVAWIAERKDVLSAFFFMLTLLAYVTYVEKAEGRRQQAESRNTLSSSILHPPSSFYYALALACFALGLMSKPMVVTLPFVLLLLDYWPLGRWQPSTVRRVGGFHPSSFILHPLLLEKLPFFALSAVACGVTLWAQNSVGAIMSANMLPVARRLANAVLSYYGIWGRPCGRRIWRCSITTTIRR